MSSSAKPRNAKESVFHDSDTLQRGLQISWLSFVVQSHYDMSAFDDDLQSVFSDVGKLSSNITLN